MFTQPRRHNRRFRSRHGLVLALLAIGALLAFTRGTELRAQATPEAPDALVPVSAPALMAPAVASAARAAVVRIEVAGPYRLPYTTPSRVQAATGSGFLVEDAAGADGETAIVVTNADVAIRGTEYNVYFDGSVDPLPARVVGVSECSDIAVLAVQGTDLPTLSWRTTNVQSDDVVYAAGYPGGVFDLVFTAGAVQSVEEDDETEWASVRTVLNHTAATDPGSSGGPLLDSAGNVAGIVFAESGSFADRNYAIAAEEGADIVELLRDGDTAESIGVTAEALPSEASVPGVWVIAVESGSPAARAGVLPGDIIRKLNRRNVGRDGTLAGYCRILRAEGGKALPIQLYRPDTGQVLDGEINGARLTSSGRFDVALVPTATPAPLPASLPTPAPDALHDVTDETGIITLHVPRQLELCAERSAAGGHGGLFAVDCCGRGQPRLCGRALGICTRVGPPAWRQRRPVRGRFLRRGVEHCRVHANCDPHGDGRVAGRRAQLWPLPGL